MASTSAATSDDEFQDAADGEGESSLLAYDNEDEGATAGDGSLAVGEPVEGSTNSNGLQKNGNEDQTDTTGGAGTLDPATTTEQGAAEPTPSPASKSKLKKMKKKKSKAALALASSTSAPPSPADSPADSALNSPIPIPASPQIVDAPTTATTRRRVPSPPPLLPPGARIGEAFANAQPFAGSASTTDGAAVQEQQEEEGPDGEPLSPRGTSTFPLPLAQPQASSSPPAEPSAAAAGEEETDQLASLPTTVPPATTSSRPFSLLSNPDSPATPTSTTSPKTFIHQSLSSHSHSDPNQTTGGGATSPSLTGMARRSELSLSGGGGSPSGGGGRGGALEGRDLGKRGEREKRVSLLELDPSPAAADATEEAEFEDESLSPPRSLSSSPSPEDGDPGTPTRSNGRTTTTNGGGHGHKRGVSEASSLGGGTGPGAEGKYGFLRQRVEQQNTILESDPAAKRASMQGMSQIRESFARVREKEEARKREREGRGTGEGEEIDWDFWGRVMSNYEEVASTNPRELSRAIQRGIPPALRGMCWQLMAATKDPALVETYTSLLKQTSPHEKSIGRDLNRTFPKHSYFMDSEGVGQENLFNVVKAYSIYDEEVGYTQGLQFIVGPLLLNMPDEEAFCVLVRLMKSYDLRSHYTPNMPGLQLRLFQFDRLLEELLPGVFMHLLRQGIKSSMYASQWFLTLFGYRFPLELVSSVFDLVFAEGVEAIFRFSVAILKRSEDKIVQLEFEDLIEFLKNELFEVYAPDPDDPSPHPLYKAQEFVREALQVKITPLMLDQFGEEWTSLCAQQSAHTLELDSLRKANAQLSSQVRQLEASLSQVNEEHCELVKQVVMAKLEREELEDELVKYKIAYADLSHQQASDGASFSRASMQAAQEREDRLSRGSTTSLWSSAMSRSSGSTGV